MAAGGGDQIVVVVLTGSGNTGPDGDPVTALTVRTADGCDSEPMLEPDAQPAIATAAAEPISKRRINTDTLPFAKCDAPAANHGSCSAAPAEPEVVRRDVPAVIIQ